MELNNCLHHLFDILDMGLSPDISCACNGLQIYVTLQMMKFADNEASRSFVTENLQLVQIIHVSSWCEPPVLLVTLVSMFGAHGRSGFMRVWFD